jgi:hypothetical protein
MRLQREPAFRLAPLFLQAPRFTSLVWNEPASIINRNLCLNPS